MQVKDGQAGGGRETARAACGCSWGRSFDISSIIYDPGGASVRAHLSVCVCVRAHR